MPLQRIYFDVYVAPLDADGQPDFDAEPIAFEHLEIRHGDTLRAELEANRRNTPGANKAPMNGASLWCWAALQRTGLLECKYAEFKERAISVQGVKGAGGAIQVDPTQPAAPTGSPSSSPTTSAEDPSSGSTPTSTTGL